MTIVTHGEQPAVPVLLFDDKCSVCRRIGGWVAAAAKSGSGPASLGVRPVGDDPAALRALNPGLDIWAAYATVHVVMPDGSMRLGGEAVTEVLRQLPATRWVAQICDLAILGVRPFQSVMDAAYVILADARPLLGCESCGVPSPWVKAVHWVIRLPGALFGQRRPIKAPHFTPHAATRPASPG